MEAEIRELVGQIYSSKDVDLLDVKHAKICEFVDSIRAAHGPLAESYLAFHLLIGSTPRSSTPHLDFSGPWSVRDFLRREALIG